MWLICDSNDHDVILTLILSLKRKNKSKENKKEILNEKTSIQASHVWQVAEHAGHWKILELVSQSY